MIAIYPVINQISYPLTFDSDDCSVIATFWAARDSGYVGSLPTVPEFRRAAGEPDVPGPNGLDNYQVWRGVQGTVLKSLAGRYWSGRWESLAPAIRAGSSCSLAVLASKLPPALRFGFSGAHRIGVAWDGSHFVVANPLAPGGSAPLPCDEATLKAAAYAVSAGYALAVTFPPQEADMLRVTEARPLTVDIPAGRQLYNLDGTPFTENHVLRNDAYSPFSSGSFRAVVINLATGGETLLLVKSAQVTGVKALPGDMRHRIQITVDGQPKGAVVEV